MVGNGAAGKPSGAIPREQIGTFKCSCGDQVFRVVSGVQFLYDKLAPKNMKPASVTLYQCIKCEGYLRQTKDGLYEIVHVAADGDEWKLGGGGA